MEQKLAYSFHLGSDKNKSKLAKKVTKENVGKEVRLAGWVDSIRNLGSLVFIALRDETGVVQLISKDVEKYSKLNRECTVTVTGTVCERTPEMVNKNMSTGEIEVEINTVQFDY